MTSYFPDFEAVEQYRQEKKTEGYIFLEGENDHLIPAHLQERMQSVFDEALASGLIWENESIVASVKTRGVSDVGKAFFTLSNSNGYEPWRDFLIKPGALPNLIIYLNKDLKAIEARAASKKHIKTEIAKRLSNQMKSTSDESNHQLSDCEQKCTTKEIEPVKSIEENKNELLKKHEFHNSTDVPESPSAAVIVGGFVALFFLAFAKVFFEKKYGHQAADAISIAFLVIVFAVPSFVTLRYIFKSGISEAPERFKKLLIGIIVFLIIGFFVAQLNGGGTNCVYRVGCF
ncbi:hypothetical protein [Cellvibrio sp. pealriver]|uniref:hypothetical protein n=1 Tax=Cellvibrio sp. pealriver TaxID=1622269 RepID=UPI00066FC888|nr:hypothetical protein [Cellvibrio sp. pealriver]